MNAGSLLGRRSRGAEVDLASFLAVVAGCALLLVRPAFTGLPATATVLVTLYVMLGSASLAVPVPGDVCRLVLQSPEVTPEQCDRVDHDLGLDKPAPQQYLTWLGRVLQGDFGKSNLTRRPVFGEIRHRMNATLELAILASAFALAIAIPMGVYAALKQDKLPDYASRLITIGWLSMPPSAFTRSVASETPRNSSRPPGPWDPLSG